jgi:SagB-type dehydrogenase family enzyme
MSYSAFLSIQYCRELFQNIAYKKIAMVSIVIAAVYSRVTLKYSNRGEQYVHMEAGHAAQNICLQAVALGAGTVVIGAFDDNAVQRVMKMEKDEEPLYIMPVVKPGR